MSRVFKFKANNGPAHIYVLADEIVAIQGSSAGDDQPESAVYVQGVATGPFDVSATAASIVAALGGHETDLT